MPTCSVFFNKIQPQIINNLRVPMIKKVIISGLKYNVKQFNNIQNKKIKNPQNLMIITTQ